MEKEEGMAGSLNMEELPYGEADFPLDSIFVCLGCSNKDTVNWVA